MCQPLLCPSGSLGMGLGSPGSPSAYWRGKMCVWHLKGPRNGNLGCCLSWKNLILFWWFSYFLLIKNAVISNPFSKTMMTILFQTAHGLNFSQFTGFKLLSVTGKSEKAFSVCFNVVACWIATAGKRAQSECTDLGDCWLS